MIVRTLCVVSIVCLSVHGSASDWPRFLGPGGAGTSADTGINEAWNEKAPKELWRLPLTDDGHAGPSVAAGKLYIVDHKGANDVVRALDLNTGEQVWSFEYPEGGGSNHGFARATPTIDNGKVYTLSRSGLLHCLAADDGKKIWGRNIIADFKGRVPQWLVAMSPVIDGDKLIVAPGGPNALIVALNKNTGETIWAGGGSDKVSYATPLVATIGGKKQYVIFASPSVLGIDSENGKVLWRLPWQTRRGINVAVPLAFKNSVFIASGYRKGCALVRVGPGRAEKVWENNEMQAHFNSPITHEGHVYGTGDPGFLMCMDPNTGKTLWKQPGFEKGGILVIDGTIIALDGKNGDVIMAALTPQAYKELGRIKAPLGGRSWTPPIVADGKLVIRNMKAIACFDLK